MNGRTSTYSIRMVQIAILNATRLGVNSAAYHASFLKDSTLLGLLGKVKDSLNEVQEYLKARIEYPINSHPLTEQAPSSTGKRFQS